MERSLYRSALLALYQLSVMLGIVLLPVALAVRCVGLRLPVHRMVTRLGNAYEDAAAGPA